MKYLNSGIKDQTDIKIWVEGNLFHTGTLALEYDSNDTSPEITELSIDPPLGEVPLRRAQHTYDEIVASGFKSILDKAEKDSANIIEKRQKFYNYSIFPVKIWKLL